MEYVKCVKSTRKIQWIVDILGNSGKSTLTKYLCLDPVFNCLSVSVDYRRAFRHGLAKSLKAYIKERGTEPSAVLIDVTRDEEGHSLHDIYGVLEELNNGDIRSVFGGTFVDFKIRMNIPIIIFSNSPPRFGSMSSDRWDIKALYKNIAKDDVYIQNAKVSSKLREWTSNFISWETHVETLAFDRVCGPLNFLDQLLFNMYDSNYCAMKQENEKQNEWLKDMNMLKPTLPGIIKLKGPQEVSSMSCAPMDLKLQAIKKQYYAMKTNRND